MFKIDPSKLSVEVKPYAILKPGEFKVVSAPQFPPVTLKNVRQLNIKFQSDNGFTGGSVIKVATGEKFDVVSWTTRRSPYEEMFYNGSREYLRQLDKLQGVKIDYDAAAKVSAKQDYLDQLYRRAGMNALACNANYKVGEKVQVFSQGEWTTGKIVRVRGDRYDVQLDDRFGTKMLDVTDGKWGIIKPLNAVACNATFINLYHIPWDGADENERSGYWFKYQGKNYGPFNTEQEARRFQKQNSSKVPFPLMTASGDSKPFGSSVKETNETKPWGMRMPMPNAVARNSSDDYKIEKIRTSQGDRWVVVGKPGSAIRLQFPTLDEAVAYKLKVSNSIAKNELNPEAEVKLEDVSDKFEVGKNYRAPWDRDWFCRVISRTPTSIKVATKSKNQRGWGPRDEYVTLRINKNKSIEQDGEVAVGQGWEFWASERA